LKIAQLVVLDNPAGAVQCLYMLFSRLVEYFGKIEATSLRNEKTSILAELFVEAEPSEIDKMVYLSLGGLRPAFDRLEFNLAEKMILRAIRQAQGKITTEQIEEKYQSIGDLGQLVVELIEQSPNIQNQSVSEVYEALEKIASESGGGSQERKVSGLAKLVGQVGGKSAKYIVRIVAGKLRLGFSDRTVIDSLSYMVSGNKDHSEALENAFQNRPDVGVLAKVVKEKGIEYAIENTTVSLGTPIVPALAQRLKTAKEMIEKMGRVYCEAKYDGTRVQIHYSATPKLNNKSENHPQEGLFDIEPESKFWVRTFTRNLDESSEMFPELQEIQSQIKAKEVILDSEAVGYDPKTGKLVPFQLTITRKRKHGIAEMSSVVPLCFFVFDIMYLDGKSLISLPLRERRKILSEVIVEHGTSVLRVDQFIETDDPQVLRDFHAQQLAQGLEGALIKQVEGKYMPGRTGFNWVKFKEAEDSRAKLSDTVDVVIMGYYLGKGKRSGFGLGAFLVGVKDENKGERQILTLAKVGTGITDAMFGELRERLEKIKISTRNSEYNVPKILEPDVWVEPKIVVEVAADEITQSPTHTTGYALRFPRLVKIRDDKSVEQTTTLDEIVTMIGI